MLKLSGNKESSYSRGGTVTGQLVPQGNHITRVSPGTETGSEELCPIHTRISLGSEQSAFRQHQL